MRSLQLLASKKYAPFFWTQFFGAFNDNFFKNALVILITFKAAESLEVSASILVTLSAGLFILPFFLFSATAGQIADKAEKSRLIRWIKLFEIIIMLLAVIGFYTDQIYYLLFVLFLMGFQSAIFGPVKYSVIPQILEEKDLMAGNALVESGTFLAILLGTILGGLAIAHPTYGTHLTSIGVVVFAVVGWLASLGIQKIPSHAKNLEVNYNFITETARVISYTKENRSIFLSIIGISWFWFVGASYLSLFPSYAKEYLSGDEYVVNLFLACFSIGIGLGSFLSERLSRGLVNARLVPVGLLGMSLFAGLIYLFSPKQSLSPSVLFDIPTFLSIGHNIWILLSMVLFAVFGGLYIVPLYALIQKLSDTAFLSRVIAGNNIVNSLFMVVSSILVMSLLRLHVDIPEIFLLIGLLNLFIWGIFAKYLKRP